MSGPVPDLEFHRLANCLPLLKGPEFDALVEDIRRHGLLDPIDLLDGKILEGRNRYRACKTTGVAVRTRPFTGDDPVAYVTSKNLHRRHMTASQRAMAAAKLATLPKGNPNLQIGKRADLPKITQPAAATLLNVGERNVRNARRVLDKGVPELIAAVEDGMIAASAAATITREGNDTQRRIVETTEQNPRKAVAAVRKQVQREEAKERFQKERPMDRFIYRDFADIPRACFRTIYLDPPYAYAQGGRRGHADQHYGTLSVEELAELPVGSLAHPLSALLWLWTTWPKIRDRTPHELMEAWGFRWVSEIVWIKSGRLGLGERIRGTTEVLVLGETGGIKLLESNIPGHLEAKRGKHSEKPEAFRRLIERVAPGPFIELFARRLPGGWDGWGDEVERTAEGQGRVFGLFPSTREYLPQTPPAHAPKAGEVRGG